jgi:hypothetical protein
VRKVWCGDELIRHSRRLDNPATLTHKRAGIFPRRVRCRSDHSEVVQIRLDSRNIPCSVSLATGSRYRTQMGSYFPRDSGAISARISCVEKLAFRGCHSRDCNCASVMLYLLICMVEGNKATSLFAGCCNHEIRLLAWGM